MENPMKRGAWQATVYGVVKRVGHDWVTKHTIYALVLQIFLNKSKICLCEKICVYTPFFNDYGILILGSISDVGILYLSFNSYLVPANNVYYKAQNHRRVNKVPKQHNFIGRNKFEAKYSSFLDVEEKTSVMLRHILQLTYSFGLRN